MRQAVGVFAAFYLAIRWKVVVSSVHKENASKGPQTQSLLLRALERTERRLLPSKHLKGLPCNIVIIFENGILLRSGVLHE